MLRIRRSYDCDGGGGGGLMDDENCGQKKSKTTKSAGFFLMFIGIWPNWMTKLIGLFWRDKAARLIVHTWAFKLLNQAARLSHSTDLAGRLAVWMCFKRHNHKLFLNRVRTTLCEWRLVQDRALVIVSVYVTSVKAPLFLIIFTVDAAINKYLKIHFKMTSKHKFFNNQTQKLPKLLW